MSDCVPVPPLSSSTFLRFYYLDYSSDVALVELRVANSYGLPTDAISAFSGVSGAVFPHSFEANYTQIGSDLSAAPNDPQAQNEIRWRVSFIDLVTGIEGHLYLPAANLDLLTGGSEELDIVSPGSPGRVLADWLNANALSVSGNAIQVSRVQSA